MLTWILWVLLAICFIGLEINFRLAQRRKEKIERIETEANDLVNAYYDSSYNAEGLLNAIKKKGDIDAFNISPTNMDNIISALEPHAQDYSRKRKFKADK